MITFAWAARSVDYKIKKLPFKSECRSAHAALTHLLQSDDSEYAVFYEKHQEFLRRHGKDAEEKLRKRPLRFIEQEGVEFRTNVCQRVFCHTQRATLIVSKTKHGVIIGCAIVALSTVVEHRSGVRAMAASLLAPQPL